VKKIKVSYMSYAPFRVLMMATFYDIIIMIYLGGKRFQTLKVPLSRFKPNNLAIVLGKSYSN